LVYFFGDGHDKTQIGLGHVGLGLQTAFGSGLQFLEHVGKFFARHPHELFERLDFGAFGVQRRAPFGGGALSLQFLNMAQARLEFLVDVAGHNNHFLDHLLLVIKFQKKFLQLRAHFF
jgi:hypothetical protein